MRYIAIPAENVDATDPSIRKQEMHTHGQVTFDGAALCVRLQNPGTMVTQVFMETAQSPFWAVLDVYASYTAALAPEVSERAEIAEPVDLRVQATTAHRRSGQVIYLICKTWCFSICLKTSWEA